MNIEIEFENLDKVKKALYVFFNQFEVCCILDSNQHYDQFQLGEYEFLAAANRDYIQSKLDKIESFKSSKWTFLQINYPEIDGNAILRAFSPLIMASIQLQSQKLVLEYLGENREEGLRLFSAIKGSIADEITFKANIEHHLVPEIDKETYVNTVEAIREDILNGKYYELNYCTRFSEVILIEDMLPLFWQFNQDNGSPFAAYSKWPDLVLAGSSPERFLRKKGNKLISQPIKGTNKTAGEENQKQLEKLKNSEKDRAENVMIVDLVRNDLARVCKAGTVVVDELFGAYPFRKVNHLISTISGNLNEDIGLREIFEATYPMGSMTGAPKLEVMKHINMYENEPRSAYSGTLGYIKPNGDFDFNVVIRTYAYLPLSGKLIYNAGGAITFDSVAEEEYEECLMKVYGPVKN